MTRISDEWKTNGKYLTIIFDERKRNGKYLTIIFDERKTNGKYLTRIADERKRGTEEERKNLRSGKGTEKSDEYKRGMQKKNGKERAAGDEKIELHLY